MGAPKGGGPVGWGAQNFGCEAQNFALFFPSLATMFFLSSLSWGSFSLNFGGVEASGPSNVRVWSPRGKKEKHADEASRGCPRRAEKLNFVKEMIREIAKKIDNNKSDFEHPTKRKKRKRKKTKRYNYNHIY